jgi:hypothetical protein
MKTGYFLSFATCLNDQNLYKKKPPAKVGGNNTIKMFRNDYLKLCNVLI